MSARADALVDRAAGRPLLARADPDAPLAWRHGRAVSVAQFLEELARVAACLDPAPAALNLAEDRYAFTLLFCALLSRGQINLLPPSRSPAAVAATAGAFGHCHTVDDGDLPGSGPSGLTKPSAPAVPRVTAGATALIAYTSGSTGEPRAFPRTWDQACTGHAGSRQRLQSWFGERFSLVATVPPQHMYGWEFSVLLPLQAEVAVHAGRPLFPADIAAALAEMPAPRVLQTTPLHLRALLASEVSLPPLAGVLSATAPLDQELAAAVEARLSAPVYEILGSTETCAMASRRTVEGPWWQPMPGIQVRPVADGCLVSLPWQAMPQWLGDLIERQAGSECFRLVGRQQDLLEIAGKRMSLAALNRQLLAIPGVLDGVIFPQPPGPGGVARLAALVVAPDLDETMIMDGLRQHADAVFLPRPLRRVAVLPRNETGKLPREALYQALRQACIGRAEPGHD